MIYLKTFSQLFESVTNPKYREPEFEIKEFYRVFKKYPELRAALPEEVDPEIFTRVGDGFDGEPSWLDSRDAVLQADTKDPAFIPFIRFCEELFKSGGMEKIPLADLYSGLNTRFKNHDWSAIAKDPDLLTKCKEAYDRALEAGVTHGQLTQEKGLVQKYPDLKIKEAIVWAGYFKDSIDYFDKVAETGTPLPVTSFIEWNGDYYTVGGRRRVFWHFYHKLSPTVWVHQLQKVTTE